MKNILLALFDIIDSDQVPQNTKRKVPYLSGSGAIHIDSAHSYSNGEASVASSTSSVLPSPTTTKDNNSNNNNQNADTVRQMSTHSNISRNSAIEPEAQHPESSNEITELITRCLRICGEEDGLLPLFKVIFAALADLPDNRYTLRLDGRGRDILLTGVITRMIRYVSEHVGLVFISDDVQCKW